MATPLLANDDLTILGGPSTINLEVDFGPEGSRGTYIYAVNGNPNDPTTEMPSDIKVLDMAINVLTSDPEYMYLYQRIIADGSPTWIQLLKLITNTYSKNYDVTFVSGSKSIQVPLISIVPLSSIANLTAANFNIQCSIVNSEFPVAVKISVSEITDNDLPITIIAKEFDGTDWVDLTGPQTVHLFITVV